MYFIVINHPIIMVLDSECVLGTNNLSILRLTNQLLCLPKSKNIYIPLHWTLALAIKKKFVDG